MARPGRKPSKGGTVFPTRNGSFSAVFGIDKKARWSAGTAKRKQQAEDLLSVAKIAHLFHALEAEWGAEKCKSLARAFDIYETYHADRDRFTTQMGTFGL